MPGLKIFRRIFIGRKKAVSGIGSSTQAFQETQDEIFNMHVALHDKGKEDYNMVLEDGDCFIDMKFVILVGEK